MSEQKQDEIIKMFDEIAPSYDLANRVMSMGVDISWRKKACEVAFQNLGTKNGIEILDVACGSGDMIKSWIENAQGVLDSENPKISKITGFEPSSKMLEVAREKLKNYDFVQFLQGQAKKLDGVKTESIDILSISYGLRNVLEYEAALSEFARVLKKGGVLVILEFLKPQNQSILQKLMNFYTRKILPIIGGAISSNYKAYKYLPNSIDNFIDLQTLSQILKNNGIEQVFAKSYSAGVCTLFVGVKNA